MQEEAAKRKGFEGLSLDDFEKRIMPEVVPAGELGVRGFDDIGALEAVKVTLREVVMLPLQRPELFSRGSLTRPVKGVLLFGPPGTGVWGSIPPHPSTSPAPLPVHPHPYPAPLVVPPPPPPPSPLAPGNGVG